MPGAASNLDGSSVPQTPVPVPVPNVRLSGAHHNARTSSTPVLPPAPTVQISRNMPMSSAAQPSTTPSMAQSSRPVAHPAPSTAVPQPSAPPARKIIPPVQKQVARPAAAPSTNQTQAQNRRSSPPARPPISPITPPLKPVQFPPPRQTHAHSTHPQQTIIAPPQTEPIEFDTNPDVLALESAISILHMQRARAKADMVALQNAKKAALEEPLAFVIDLQSNRIRMRGETVGGGDHDEDSSSDDDENEADGDTKMAEGDGHRTKQSGSKSDPDAMAVDGISNQPKPWATLPSKQSVVRCPPINWGQYAIVGESLDKLHKEQINRPTQGAPATITPDGMYEFKGTGKQEELVGIMAPYDPLRDKLGKKPKGPN